jgi:geranylgeranyl reductase family protein
MPASGESDVLIIGAGPTGCAAGITLARRGLRVTVVDRAVFPRDKTCGDAVSNDGLELLGRLGARKAVDALPNAPVARAAAAFPDGTRITREYDRPGLIIARYHLDDCLRLTLQEAGATLVQGRSVARLSKDGDRFTGGEGTGFSCRAKVTIAADGYGSVGVTALGASRPRGRLLAISATAYYRNVGYPHGADTADHHFDPDLPYGYGWIFPAVEGVTNLGVYLRTDGYERAHRKLKDLMDRFLVRHRDRLRHAEPASPLRVWSLPLAPNPMPISAPGLLLSGDAASLVDPLTGEGIWQGLHSGMLAGDAAANAVHHGNFDSFGAYEAACAATIGRPSRVKAWIQRAMLEIVDRELYRNPLIRAGLTWGYEHRALEMTKS